MKPRTVKETLTRARNLIRDKRHWIRGSLNNGNLAEEKEPTKWCALGALDHVDGRFEDRATRLLASAVWRVSEGRYCTVALANDSWNGHQIIMKAFNEAIRVCGDRSQMQRLLNYE